MENVKSLVLVEDFKIHISVMNVNMKCWKTKVLDLIIKQCHNKFAHVDRGFILNEVREAG